MRRERRSGNQISPKDKQNYLIICLLFVMVMTLILRDKEPGQFVAHIISTVIGGFIGFITAQHIAPQSSPGTDISAQNVESVTVGDNTAKPKRGGTQDLDPADAPKKAQGGIEYDARPNL